MGPAGCPRSPGGCETLPASGTRAVRPRVHRVSSCRAAFAPPLPLHTRRQTNRYEITRSRPATESTVLIGGAEGRLQRPAVCGTDAAHLECRPCLHGRPIELGRADPAPSERSQTREILANWWYGSRHEQLALAVSYSKT